MEAINFKQAWMMPGVLQYSFCYFCLKFSVYGILYWLPLYITLNADQDYTDHQIALTAAMYDVGAIIGALFLGFVSD